MVVWAPAYPTPTMKIKLTNEVLDQLSFEHIPVGIDAKGKLVTRQNPVKADKHGAMTRRDPYIVRDTDTRGFAVCVSPNSKSFFVQRKMGGSTSLKRTFGSYGREYDNVSDARVTAQIWLGRMAAGDDPIVIKKTQQDQSREALEKMRNTFAKAYGLYMTYKQGGAPSSVRDRLYVKEEICKTVLWNTPLDKITTTLVEKTFRPWFEKGKIATGWKIYRCCRAAYGIATGKPGQDPTNPFSVWRSAASLPDVPVRDTYLPTHKPEGALWLKTLVNLRDNTAHTINVAADYLLCVLLWGGRKTETQVLQWRDVDFENRTITFQSKNTKNKTKHVFPLTPFAAELLTNRKEKNYIITALHKNKEDNQITDWVFPSRVHGTHIVDIRNILKSCQTASGLDIQVHDLRRTFATQLATKTDLSTVKLAMNHANAKRDVTWGYVQEKIELLRPLYEARETHLLQLAGLSSTPVIQSTSSLSKMDFDELKLQMKDARVRRLVLKAIMDADEALPSETTEP